MFQERSDLCSADAAIMAECHVCYALGSTTDLCCTDIDEFIGCHMKVLEFFVQMQSIENNVIEPYDSYDQGYDYQDMPQKRYGTVFSKWNWFRSRKNKDLKDKRYGTVFGNFGKRYGTVFGGSRFSKTSRPKRYGSLMGKSFSTKW